MYAYNPQVSMIINMLNKVSIKTNSLHENSETSPIWTHPDQKKTSHYMDFQIRRVSVF